MQSVWIAIFVLALAGCTTTAPTQMYHGASPQSEPWAISGELNYFSSRLIIRINGENAIEGHLPMFDEGGEIHGVYNERNMTARCNKIRFSKNVKCVVLVDDEKVAILWF